MTEQTQQWSIELLLCPEAKGNSRRILRRGRAGRLMIAKSAKAEGFVRAAAIFMANNRPPEPFRRGDKLALYVSVRYPDYRRDLDVSLIKDALQQARITPNDSHIREEHSIAEDEIGEPRIRIRLTRIGTLPWKSKARG